MGKLEREKESRTSKNIGKKYTYNKQHRRA